jgi:hypothetical protein
VIDSVHDLDNVIYEISNESEASSKDWQYHLTRFIKQYEATKPKQHLVLMSGYTVPTADLFAGPADIVAPAGIGKESPAATGAKVVIVDSDHNGLHRRDPGFVWKAFLRGCHPIVMDWWSGPEWTPIRRAMGQTRTFADKIGLAALTPQPELSSTKYCLAKTGSRYLVYQPASMAAFTVTLEAGAYEFEWFDPAAGQVAATGSFAAEAGSRSFTAPFPGEAVLLLARRQAESNKGRSGGDVEAHD